MKQCSQSAVRVVHWIEKNDAERAADEMRAHLNIVTVNLKQQFPRP
jgi:DNA-binding GntR family transcriptional regulator